MEKIFEIALISSISLLSLAVMILDKKMEKTQAWPHKSTYQWGLEPRPVTYQD